MSLGTGSEYCPVLESYVDLRSERVLASDGTEVPGDLSLHVHILVLWHFSHLFSCLLLLLLQDFRKGFGKGFDRNRE